MHWSASTEIDLMALLNKKRLKLSGMRDKIAFLDIGIRQSFDTAAIIWLLLLHLIFCVFYPFKSTGEGVV
jgi:hypothetical protein